MLLQSIANWFDGVCSIFKEHAMPDGENAKKIWDILEPRRYYEQLTLKYLSNLFVGGS